MTSSSAQSQKSAYEGELIDQSRDFLTIVLADQIFGIPILQVQDVLGEQKVTKIPLAPPEVAGSLNLRGRIVTAINMRSRLGLPTLERKTGRKNMSVVVEHENELYSLVIDQVGDVLTLKNGIEPTPATLDSTWREISSGVYRLEDSLLVILDVSKFLDTVHV
ncbi:MAG: chemotaxis protein CheW [Alphaproteobacteria bacterium]|nr:chemotaxis protein CheW [Alphaproteobacteria bacterium]